MPKLKSSSSKHDFAKIAEKGDAKLLYSSFVTGAFIFLSRVFGLIRDILMAAVIPLGSDLGYDLLVAAQRIPNFFRRLFAEGAVSQAFLPVLSQYQNENNQKDTQLFINTVFGTLAVVLLVICTLGMIGAPWIIYVFVPGFAESPERIEGAGHLLRIVFPYLFFISLTGLAGGVLNSFRQFAASAFTPVLLNLSLIFSVLCLSPFFDLTIEAVAWGWFIAGILQLGFQLPFLWRLGVFPIPRFDWFHPGVKKILKLMGPTMISVSVAQINILLDSILASFLVAGSMSWLYYSDRLMEFPLGIIAIAISIVILPSLSRDNIIESKINFDHTLDWALKMMVIIGVPASLGLFLLAEPLMTTLFFHGVFREEDVVQGALSLRAYALGLPALMMVKVLVSAYFARHDTKLPMKVAIISMSSNMVFNLLLIFSLAHVGLALATSLSALINAALLLYFLIKVYHFKFDNKWGRFLFKLALANMLMLMVVLIFTPKLDSWLLMDVYARVSHLLFIVGFAICCYMLMLLLLGFRLKDFHRQKNNV